MDKGRWAYDMHIHSALSPCGHNEMTPNNIINMSCIKGLDIIAITDHNSAKNLPAIFEVAKDKELLIIPGIEITTKEEVHLLCYFPTLEYAMDFDKYIESYLLPISNNIGLFGDQLILNKEDDIIGKIECLLLNALQLSMEEIFRLMSKWEGVIIPAHIDRTSYSIISNLGFIPPHLPIKTVELSRNIQNKNVKPWSDSFKKYRFIQSSDAHSLDQILERHSFMEMDELSIREIFTYLKNNN